MNNFNEGKMNTVRIDQEPVCFCDREYSPFEKFDAVNNLIDGLKRRIKYNLIRAFKGDTCFNHKFIPGTKRIIIKNNSSIDLVTTVDGKIVDIMDALTIVYYKPEGNFNFNKDNIYVSVTDDEIKVCTLLTAELKYDIVIYTKD